MRELQEVRQTIKELENEREETDKKIQQLDNCIWRGKTAGFAKRNGRDAKLSGRSAFV